jgi:hypothetical protein
MPHAGRQVGFAVEALTEVGILGERGGQNFQCVPARQPGMLSQVNLAHAP